LGSEGDAGVLVSLIARSSTHEALSAAEDLIAPFGEGTRAVHRSFADASDSVGFRSTFALAEGVDGPWIESCLWAGAVPFLGPPSVALVGSYDEVAGALMNYRRAGASQFLFMGWPDIEEMARFGGEVLPRVRELEALETGELVMEGGAQ
jgi:alkanesulfonate monooxygenase